MRGLAELAKHDERTARRHVDAALARLAKVVTDGGWARDGDVHVGSGWYVDHLDVVLRLDNGPVRSIERRTIVATRNGLDRVVNSVDVLPPDRDGTPSPARMEVMFGAMADPVGAMTGHHFESQILLSRDLRRAERHTYGVVITSEAMASHFVCVPLRKHKSFDLTVRFDPGRRPAAAWVLDHARTRAIDEHRPTPALLEPDRAGEVRWSFGRLKNGLAYGIQWRW